MGGVGREGEGRWGGEGEKWRGRGEMKCKEAKVKQGGGW